MDPSRADFVIDIAYGVLIFLSIVLIMTVGTAVGIAFGLGSLISYIIHVGWKMARFDPEWMAEEVTENIEETLTEEVTENVEAALSEEITSIIDQLEEVNERIERRPRRDEIEGSEGEDTE